jgi:hypothetical protein
LIVESDPYNDLPAQWQATGSGPLPSQTFLLNWLRTPDCLCIQLPSAVVPQMANYLVHPAHLLFADCRLVSNEPFNIDRRLYGPFRKL